MADTLTEEEHKARAMLMGMRYHDGNGEPFYYKEHADGTPAVESFINAGDLSPVKPLFDGINRRIKLMNQRNDIKEWVR